jgi:hypothetical protein
MDNIKNKLTDLDLEIDEEYLFRLVEGLKSLINIINKNINVLEMKDGDLFERYINSVESRSILLHLSTVYKINKFLLISGHNISHELLNNEEAKHSGWGDINLGEDYFFNTKSDHKNQDNPRIFADRLVNDLINGLRTNEKDEPTSH